MRRSARDLSSSRLGAHRTRTKAASRGLHSEEAHMSYDDASPNSREYQQVTVPPAGCGFPHPAEPDWPPYDPGEPPDDPYESFVSEPADDTDDDATTWEPIDLLPWLNGNVDTTPTHPRHRPLRRVATDLSRPRTRHPRRNRKRQNMARARGASPPNYRRQPRRLHPLRRRRPRQHHRTTAACSTSTPP